MHAEFRAMREEMRKLRVELSHLRNDGQATSDTIST
jgi:hypothetical protein